MPGLIDTHIHGAQVVNCGRGYDLELLAWLKKYTFPVERRFADQDYASRCYARVVAQTLASGTTTACYFGSIHRDGTMCLTRAVEALGQRAYIGKVCMDCNSAPDYVEDTGDALADARAFAEDIISLKNPRITPVITPRFAPSCTRRLLEGLGELAAELDLPVQSHLCESHGEIAWVRQLFPDAENYAAVYDECGLLTPKTVMAHCVYLDDAEIALMRTRGANVSHCAASNFNLGSGICPVRRLLAGGLRVGLGTDASGGESLSILDAARQAIIASRALELTSTCSSSSKDKISSSSSSSGSSSSSRAPPAPLSHTEALFLATLGGAQALALDSVTGSFEAGKWFDALVVDLAAEDSPVVSAMDDTLQDRVSRFLYTGDDRTIAKVFVGGKDVTPPPRGIPEAL